VELDRARRAVGASTAKSEASEAGAGDHGVEGDGTGAGGSDDSVGERVRAMMAARARRGIGMGEGDGEGQEEDAGDVATRRARLCLGSWAGPRMVAKKEKLRFGKDGVARREKRKAEVCVAYISFIVLLGRGSAVR